MRRVAGNAKLQFLRWWHAPITLKDRIQGALIGAMAGFWITGLGRLMLDAPVALGDLTLSAMAGAMVSAALGARFPKAAVFFFPFALVGIGS